jgi:hypothetical protein
VVLHRVVEAMVVDAAAQDFVLLLHKEKPEG